MALPPPKIGSIKVIDFTPKPVTISHTSMAIQNVKFSPAKKEIALKMLLHPTKVTHVFKCVLFDCYFTTNERKSFEEHVKEHGDLSRAYPCIYCPETLKLPDIPQHLYDIHGPSNFYCGYCLYKAVCVNYTRIHQRLKHPGKNLQVYAGSNNAMHSVALEFVITQTCPMFHCGKSGKFLILVE